MVAAGTLQPVVLKGARFSRDRSRFILPWCGGFAAYTVDKSGRMRRRGYIILTPLALRYLQGRNVEFSSWPVSPTLHTEQTNNQGKP